MGAKKHLVIPYPLDCLAQGVNAVSVYPRSFPHFTPLSSFFNHPSPPFPLFRPTSAHHQGMKKARLVGGLDGDLGGTYSKFR